MKLFLISSLCSILILSHTNSRAQQKPAKKDSTAAKKSHWQAGITYLSNDVYLGRKDSISVPYITPSIGYHDKSGFFITGSLSYLPSSGENRIDLFTLEGGYSYTSDHFNAEVSAAKDFYSDQSFAVSSEIKGRLSAYLSYDLDFIEPSLELGANFSNSPDFGLGLGLEHSFSAAKDKLDISPAFHINISTQNYYAGYYSKRRYAAKRKAKQGNSSGSTTASVANASSFQIMDYELSIPVEYTLNKKLKFNFTPTLALPVNPSTVTLVTKSSGGSTTTQTSTESLSSSFYISVGVNYTF